MSGTPNFELVDKKISELKFSYNSEYDYDENTIQNVELFFTPTFYSDDEDQTSVLLIVHLEILSKPDNEELKTTELELKLDYNFYYRLIDMNSDDFFKTHQNEVDMVADAYPYISAYISTITALSDIRTFNLPPFSEKNIEISE